MNVTKRRRIYFGRFGTRLLFGFEGFRGFRFSALVFSGIDGKLVLDPLRELLMLEGFEVFADLRVIGRFLFPLDFCFGGCYFFGLGAVKRGVPRFRSPEQENRI